MSKCIKCGNELLTGDIYWDKGLCNNCYGQLPKGNINLNANLENMFYAYSKILEEKDQQIEELKAEIERKDHDYTLLKELYKMKSQELDNYRTEKYDLGKRIEEIRQIKLSPKQKEIFIKGFEMCENQCASHIVDLQQQLQEKDAEIEQLKSDKFVLECMFKIVNNPEKDHMLKLIQEKDAEIERLKSKVYTIESANSFCINEYKKSCKEIKKLKQSQNQKDEEIESLKKEIELLKNEPHISITKYNRHGCKHTRLYEIWCGMKNRCYSPNNPSYKYYGARGIKLCDEWVHNFTSFREWAENNGYEDGLSIDRIDNDGIYEPKNCRWVTISEQASHQRKIKILNVNNENFSLRELSEIYNINTTTLYYRIFRLGWSIDKALNTPTRKKNIDQLKKEMTDAS